MLAMNICPNLCFPLLDYYEEQDQLCWYGGAIPAYEIYIKVRGDHGRGSFKFMLQVGNVKLPNSKLNTFMMAIINAKDSHKNLERILLPYKQQLDNLSKMTWKGNQIKVFLFGDYDFLLKVFGISGAQSIYPCLWCTASKGQLQKVPADQPELPRRTF